jgi:hypothetical protein
MVGTNFLFQFAQLSHQKEASALVSRWLDRRDATTGIGATIAMIVKKVLVADQPPPIFFRTSQTTGKRKNPTINHKAPIVV